MLKPPSSYELVVFVSSSEVHDAGAGAHNQLKEAAAQRVVAQEACCDMYVVMVLLIRTMIHHNDEDSDTSM